MSRSTRERRPPGACWLLGALLLLGSGDASATPWKGIAVGQKLPALRLPRIEGGSVALTPTGARALLVLYLRADQPRAARAVRALTALQRTYGKKGLRVLLVASTRHGGAAAARRLRRETGTTLPLLLDANDALKAAGGLFIQPTTGIFDREGRLHAHYAGYRADYRATVEQQIRAALGLGPAPTPNTQRATATPATRRRRRQQAMDAVRQRLALRRARRKLEAGRAVLAPDSLSRVLALYARWSALLPLPAKPALARAAARVRAGRGDEALPSLRRQVAAGEPGAALWLGRALSGTGAGDEARGVFKSCLGRPALRGQCEFELARLLASEAPARAVALCRRGYELALPGTAR